MTLRVTLLDDSGKSLYEVEVLGGVSPQVEHLERALHAAHYSLVKWAEKTHKQIAAQVQL